MTTNVNVAIAKAKLSELMDRAIAGEEIVLARAGKPLVRLVPVNGIKGRKKGAWRGWAAGIATDVFLAPMDPEDLDAAEGSCTEEFGVARPLADKL